MTRVKLAELTSGIECHIHRVGRGGAAHAFGMWDKHQLERQCHIEVSRWAAGLYWTCWLLLAAFVVLPDCAAKAVTMSDAPSPFATVAL